MKRNNFRCTKWISWTLLTTGFLWFFGAALVAAPVTAQDADFQVVRQYTEQKGDQVKKVVWQLSRHGQGYQLSYIKGMERHLTQTDERMDTLTWSMTDPNGNSAIEAIRAYDTILLRGNIGNHRIEKDIKVDDAPWFQATSLSLKRFVLSDRQEMKFWTIRPDNLKAYKLRAVKAGNETLEIADRRIETVRVQLCLTGWRAPFWKCQYWFDAVNGDFLRFEGQADPLGESRFTVTYNGSSGAGTIGKVAPQTTPGAAGRLNHPNG